MTRSYLLSCFLFHVLTVCFAQSGGDQARSVPCYFDFNEATEEAVLKWTLDPDAEQYVVYKNNTPGDNNALIQAILPSTQDSFVLEGFVRGEVTEYLVEKRRDGSTVGVGSINLGIEIPLVHHRGNLLILIEKSLAEPLSMEIERWRQDVFGDGWKSDTLHIDRNLTPLEVKSYIENWYNSLSVAGHRSLALLGNIPVPYSGNIVPDGHSNHRGAWVADTYYGDLDGNWTDNVVNNVSASRTENRNIPGDGKFDQSIIPSAMEIEIGRIDLSRLPAFADDEIALTRQYLNKNHQFRNKMFAMPRRAVIENNFLGFDEGFGQNGFNNFTPMFGPDQVSYGNYDEVLKTEDYLCAYACGAGSYQSAGGIGTTSNLYASHELNTVFVMNFGSYFGDWDISDNFLRAALGSGKILTNSWAGRPNWHITHMALGKHIGYSAAISQFNNLYPTGLGGRSVHASLLGDPTLRLHVVEPPKNLSSENINDRIQLTWEASGDADAGYIIYRRGEGELDFVVLEEGWPSTEYFDDCTEKGIYEYMVKAVKLEFSYSGTYYNTSIGKTINIEVENSTVPRADFTVQKQWERIEFTNVSNEFSESFAWDFGDGNTSVEENPIHQYEREGLYEVCLIAAKGTCKSDTICQVINVLSSQPKIQSQLRDPRCYGGSDGEIAIFWTGGDGNHVFLWGDSIIGNTRSNLKAGDYDLTVISTTGREEMYSFTLEQPDSLVVIITTTPSSGADGTVSLEILGGVEPYSIDWGDALIDTTTLVAGVYEVLVVDANDCSVRLIFTIDRISSTFELNESKNIDIFPNPIALSNQLTLTSKIPISSYQIFDQRGAVIRKKTIVDPSSEIHFNEFPYRGVFFLEVIVNGTKEIRKIIVH